VKEAQEVTPLTRPSPFVDEAASVARIHGAVSVSPSTTDSREREVELFVMHGISFNMRLLEAVLGIKNCEINEDDMASATDNRRKGILHFIGTLTFEQLLIGQCSASGRVFISPLASHQCIYGFVRS
jgi:hypothetical protein